jgi:hypothetical protein
MDKLVCPWFVGADVLIGPPFDRLTVKLARSGNRRYRGKQYSYRIVLGRFAKLSTYLPAIS